MLQDYQDFDRDPLKIPIRGKVYEIPELGAKDGARIRLEQDPKTAKGMTSEELRRIVLGSALKQMIADNVPQPAIGRALMAAITDAERGRTAAELMWNTGGDPKAITETVKTLISETSTSTDEDSTTNSPASTNGTKSPDPS